MEKLAEKTGIKAFVKGEFFIKCRVSKHEMNAIKKAAKLSGKTVSSFVRSLSLEGAGVAPFFNVNDLRVMAKFIVELNKIGVNINQIARALNSQRQVHNEEIRIQISNLYELHQEVIFQINYMRRASARRRLGDADE